MQIGTGESKTYILRFTIGYTSKGLIRVVKLKNKKPVLDNRNYYGCMVLEYYFEVFVKMAPVHEKWCIEHKK